MWLGIIWIVSIAAQSATLTDVLKNAKAYSPPECRSHVCELYGPGGIVSIWTKHVDRNMAIGRRFIVTGACASACMIAAIRAHAPLVGPDAKLIPHEVTVWN